MPDPQSPARDRDASLSREIAWVETRNARLEGLSTRLTWLRLGLFVVLLLTIAAAFALRGWAAALGVTVAGAIVFGLAVAWHRRIERALRRQRTWLALQRAQRARLALRWDALPPPLAEPPPPEHPFAGDIDLFGPRSLLHLADLSATRQGGLRLASWLAAEPATPDTLRERQETVRELRERRWLRDRLALEGLLAAPAEEAEDQGPLAARWDLTPLRAWMTRDVEVGRRRGWLLWLGLLAATNAALFLAFRAELVPPWWRLSFGLYVVSYFVATRGLGEPAAEATRLERALRQLGAVLRRLERAPLSGAPRLQARLAPFRAPDDRPSEHLRRMLRLVAATAVRGNPLAWLLLNAAMPWDLFFALRLAEARRAVAARVPAWLDAWQELEALSSLANLAWLHPEWTMPEVGEEADPLVSATGLGHPLLAAEAKVRNDLQLGLGEVLIVTGSNMSGKSTFLRTIGLNAVLALAGGPVDAAALRIGRARLFTAIRVSDSVADGISYFYAEVRRLRALLDALRAEGEPPLLYLVDEIFRGTNNRERLVGSRSMLRALADGRGAGLVSTHDLELVALEEELARARNLHFRETITEGRMVFDYRVRPGPCPTTNALAIMREAGLPLPEERG